MQAGAALPRNNIKKGGALRLGRLGAYYYFSFLYFYIFIMFTILMYFARLRLRAAFLFLMRLTAPFYLFIYFNLCNEKNQRRKAARK